MLERLRGDYHYFNPHAQQHTVIEPAKLERYYGDLVQSLEMGRKSCLLTMLNSDDRCEIYFSSGQAKHAVYGATRGDEAVFKVLRWTDGNFEIDFTKSTTEESTTLNTQGLQSRP